MAQQRSARKSTVWFPNYTLSGTALDSLAQNAQATLADFPIEHPGTNQDYEGAIFGVRIWVTPIEAMTNAASLQIVLLKLPQGLAIPSVVTTATLKQNEGYVWAQSFRGYQAAGVASVNPINPMIFELSSGRRFEAGDRLVLVAINRGPALSTTQEFITILDAYIMPR